VKSARGVSSPEQIMFANLVRHKQGFAAVVRSVDEARAALDRCRNGANE
jgi:hypothetical protein